VAEAKRKKLLVLELWGLGDLTFSTPMLRAAVARYDVTLVGKAHAKPLLAATFPTIQFIAYDAPWSAYRGKYRLWAWRWPLLLGLINRLRCAHFDAAVSVRNDPRDHFLMWNGHGRNSTRSRTGGTSAARSALREWTTRNPTSTIPRTVQREWTPSLEK
jgi:ADP-heptose:LPS heptosyltransferase